jgi:hypothetical protein
MLHFLMKALWHLETKESNNGANLFASNFANIFAMLCMRLIGRKSVTCIACAFFGRSIMFDEFNMSKPWEFSENKLLIAAMMSSLIMSQQVLKKAPI